MVRRSAAEAFHRIENSFGTREVLDTYFSCPEIHSNGHSNYNQKQINTKRLVSSSDSTP